MYIGIGLVACTVYFFFLRAENARRARGERDEIIVGVNDMAAGANSKNGTFESVEDAKREKGDSWSGYRYTM